MKLVRADAATSDPGRKGEATDGHGARVRFVDASVRSATAVSIVLGLIAMVVGAYWWRGFEEAERLYGLLQGLILGAFGWLYGSHGAERAERVAAESVADQRVVVGEARSVAADIAALEARVEALRNVVLEVRDTPEVGAKVEAALREIGEG